MQTTPGGCPPGRRDGFTFVEIITALVLLSLFAGLAVPEMRGYVDKARTRAALDQLVADAGYARLYAIERGRRTQLRVFDDAAYRLDTLSLAGEWGTLKTVNLATEYPGVHFIDDSHTLRFNSRGVMIDKNTNSQIILVKGEARDSVYVSQAGRFYRAY